MSIPGLTSWKRPENGGTPIQKPEEGSFYADGRKRRAESKEKFAPKREINDAPVPVKTERMVRERDGDRCCSCGYCGGEERPDGTIVKTHIDHIIPRAAGIAAGGTNNEENLRVMCDRCNLGKGARRENVKPKRVKKPKQLPPVTVDNNAFVDRLAVLVGKKKQAEKGVGSIPKGQVK